MLEDDFTYVLRKALLGHALTPATVAPLADLSEPEVQDFLNGAFSPTTARKLAGVLGLKVDAFAAHEFYQPKDVAVSGIHRLILPFNGDHVNAWALGNEDFLILFDAGNDAADLIRGLQSQCGRLPDQAFITHSHRDHVGGIGDLRAVGVPFHGPAGCGVSVMIPGTCAVYGTLSIHACDLSGHAMPALAYHVNGFPVPVLVTGDAIFAGSIGGCPTPSRYQLALSRLREILAPLPDQTLLLPGHGPATTLGEERVSNPFL